MTTMSILKAIKLLDELYGMLGYECSGEIDGGEIAHYAKRDNEVITHIFGTDAEDCAVFVEYIKRG